MGRDAGAGPRTERVYVHRTCGGATVVSGDDFAELANPFVWVSQTYCAGCRQFVGLGAVAWEDTGEPLDEYRRRMRGRAPASLTLWVYLVGPALATLIGAGIGFLIDRATSRGPFVGGVTGLLLGGGFIAPRFARFWGIDYRDADRRRPARSRRPAADELEPVALVGPDDDEDDEPAPRPVAVTLQARCPHCRTVQGVSGRPPSIAYTCSGCGKGALVPVPAAALPPPPPKPAPPVPRRRPRPRWDDEDDRPARRRPRRTQSSSAPAVLLGVSLVLIAAGSVLAVRLARSRPAPAASPPVGVAAAPTPAPALGGVTPAPSAPAVPYPLTPDPTRTPAKADAPPAAGPKPPDPPAPKPDPSLPRPADLAAATGWDGHVYLALLPEFGVKNGPWPYAKDGTVGSPDRKPIAVGGHKARHGLGMHPPDGGFGYAGVKYRVGGKAARLEAGVALNDSADERPAPAVFEVWGDGKRLWQSPPVGKKGEPTACRVDLAGVDVLELRVSTGGLHIGVHAVWVDPRLVPADGEKAEAPE